MKRILLAIVATLQLQGCGGKDYKQHYVAVCPGVADTRYSREVTHDALGGKRYGPAITDNGAELLRIPETCIVKKEAP